MEDEKKSLWQRPAHPLLGVDLVEADGPPLVHATVPPLSPGVALMPAADEGPDTRAAAAKPVFSGQIVLAGDEADQAGSVQRPVLIGPVSASDEAEPGEGPAVLGGKPPLGSIVVAADEADRGSAVQRPILTAPSPAGDEAPDRAARSPMPALGAIEAAGDEAEAALTAVRPELREVGVQAGDEPEIRERILPDRQKLGAIAAAGDEPEGRIAVPRPGLTERITAAADETEPAKPPHPGRDALGRIPASADEAEPAKPPHPAREILGRIPAVGDEEESRLAIVRPNLSGEINLAADELDGKPAYKQFFFGDGLWLPASDPAMIGEKNFADLQNFRYMPGRLEGVQGYSKINTTVLSTYLKIRSGIQLTTPFTTPSRILVQAENSGLTASQVLQNKTAVPGQGDFEATELHNDGAGGGLGRFARWPNNHIAYCNGIETMVWAGDETKVAAFITSSAAVTHTVTDPVDYTEAVRNNLQTSGNIARIGGGNDTYTKLLLHGEGADGSTTITDSAVGGGAPPKTVTAAGSAQIDKGQKKFGTGSIQIWGSGDYVYVPSSDPDIDDFYMGTGAFTIDFWLRLATRGDDQGIFTQYVDDNNYVTYRYHSTDELAFIVKSGGSYTITCGTTTSPISAVETWYHIALIRGWGGSNTTIAITVGGIAAKILTGESDAWPDLNASFDIGRGYYTGPGQQYLYGWIDEFRVSKGIARWTANFTPPSRAYQTSRLTWLVGSTRPPQGHKFYIPAGSGNPVTGATISGKVWNGVSWDTLSLTDNTSGGETTDTVTFASAVENARPKLIEGYFLYWVQYTLSAGEFDLYQCTVDEPWQALKDLWDGIWRPAIQFRHYHSSVWYDDTYLVYETVPAGVTGSSVEAYECNIGGLTSSEYYEFCTSERAAALKVTMDEIQASHTNTAVATIALYYWNGEGYVEATGLVDGTLDSGGTKTHNRSGILSWTPPDPGDETQRTQFGVTGWWYRVQPSATLSADCWIDRVQAIPAPRTLNPAWRFPFMFQGRPMLCGAVSEKEGHRVDYGMTDAVDVWNGEDSSDHELASPLYFGDSGDLTAAVEIYNRLGSSIYTFGLFTKAFETYILNGYDAESFTIFPLSATVGCPAALTLDTMQIAQLGEEGDARGVALWLSHEGPAMFDAGRLTLVEGIGCYFDPNDSRCIHFGAIEAARGCFDPEYPEYHLLIPSGSAQTTINCWLVYNWRFKRWFRMVPNGTAVYPQAIFRVSDATGKQYLYGAIDTGYLMRLNHGTTWDGQGIVQHVRTADLFPAEDIWQTTRIRRLKTITNPITEDVDLDITHYADGAGSGTSLSAHDLAGSNRQVRRTQRLNLLAWSHQVGFSVTTSNETPGVKLLAWGIEYTAERIDE